MSRRLELDSLLTSQLRAGPAMRLLFRLRRAHPELAFEVDQICEALKAATDNIARAQLESDLAETNSAAHAVGS